MKNFSIKGQIVDDASGKALSGLDVEAWSIQKDAKAPLATAITKKSGKFKFSTEDGDDEALAVLRKVPRIRLKIYAGSALLRGPYLDQIFNLVNWDNDLVIEVSEDNTVKPGETTCTVQGIVYDPKGVPVPGLLVKASDQALRSAAQLGQATTTADGQYLIRYTSTAKARKSAGQTTGYAEISLEITNADGTVVYQSDADTLLYNADQHAKLDIHLSADPRPQTIEFNTIASRLSVLTKGLSIDQLGETNQYADISFLANETGIDYSFIGYFVLSYKVQTQFKLLPPFTYALLREGTLQATDLTRILNSRTSITVNSDVEGLAYDIALLPADQIRQATESATEKFIIPDISKQLPGIMAQLGKMQQAAQNYVQNVRPQQWINTVAGSLSTGAYTGLVDALSKNYYGDLPALFRAIVNANPFPVAGDLAQTSLPPELGALLKELPAPSGSAGTGGRGSASAGSAGSGGAGSGSSGGGSGGTGSSGAGLGRTAMGSHAAFVKKFEKDEKHLFPAKDKMLDALRRAPGANLGSGSIDAQVKHLNLPDETRSGLRKLQRLYKLAPRYEQAKALHKDGLHAGYHIVAMGKKQFVRKYTKNNTFTEKEALKVYNKASTAHTAALMLAGELRDYAGLGHMKNLGGAKAAKVIEAVNKDFPNLKSLFGESDYCECADCRNVWSPAAYVVDVLQFLRNRLVMGGTKTAKDILFTRRPDLGDIDLNCDNAYVELPYIDLVCEILEEAVSPDPGLALDGTYTVDMVPGAVTAHLLTALQGAGYQATSAAILYPSYVEGIVTTFILRDTLLTLKISQSGAGWIARELRQTHLSQQELVAAPEYVNSAAYTVLQTSNVSFSLPFDLFQQQAESLLETVGIHRDLLMNAFQVAGVPAATDIAAVNLGIPPGDEALIVTTDPVNQAKYWNTGVSNPLTVVNEVDVFLQKSGIVYTDLQTLLLQSFINPTGTIYIKHMDSSCDTSKKDLINLDLAALDRMHRFIRLWNKTGLPMDDLNSVITYPALGNNTLDGNVLIFLSGLQNLVNELGISFDQALSFYGPMPDDSPTALYQTVFLNLILTNPVDPAFTLVNIIANEALAPGTQDTLANHLTTICLCLKRSATDVNFLISQLVTVALPVPPLTRANLAILYSNSILANALGMSITDMYSLSGLSGKPLFGIPANTIGFAETVALVQGSGLGVSDLQWYLNGQDPTGLRAITDANVTSFLQTLQTAYQAAYAATASGFDTNATPTENLNGLKQLLGKMPPNPPGSPAGAAPVLTSQVINQIVSIANDSWVDTPAAAQTLIANSFANYFSAAAIAQLQAEANTVLTGGGLPADENVLIGDLCANASLFLYTAAKNAALYATVDSVFGTADNLTQVILNNAALHYPPPGIGGPPTLLSLLSDDSLVDKVNNPPQPPVIAPAAFDLQFRATRLLSMIVGYTNSFSPTAKDLQWFLVNNPVMGWMPLDQLKYQGDPPAVAFSAWSAFAQVQQLMVKYPPVTNPANPSSTLEWTDVWNQLITLTGLPALQTAIVGFTNWDPTDVAALIAYFGYGYPASVATIPGSAFANPATWLQLDQTTALLRLAGMPMSDIAQVIQPSLGQTQVNLITVALRNKYTEDQWLSVIQPVMNALRPQKRDALVTYLLAMDPSLAGTDDLYDYFLVDTEMQPIQLTSRIVLEHGTLQLFIQRCLMGLEPQATADIEGDDGWEQWTWMANYQVWVANRKIFLYPENWFAPELRTNMSPFFTDLISTLQQNQVTDDNVQAAALNYLDDLDNVSNLDVRACYYDVKTYIFHVIARVRGGSSYYYRTCANENSWSAWTQVNVDISGDCLLCFVRNSRLYIAWPLYTEDTLQAQAITVPSQGDTVAPQAPQKRYEIQLAVSEYTDGNWQPKRVSQDMLLTDYYPNAWYPDADLASMQDTFRMINFDLGTAGDDIVCSFGNDSVGGATTLGTFALTGCKGYPQAVNFSGGSIPDYELIPQFEFTDFLQMQYRQESNPPETGFIAKTILNPFSYKSILDTTPSLYQVVYPHEFSLLDYIYILLELLTRNNNNNNNDSAFGKQRGYVFPMASFMPFFFEDSDRDYVIIPGFFSKDGTETQTFSDIYQFVLNVIALIKKYIAIFLADPTHNVSNLITELLNDTTFQDLWKQWLFYVSTQPQFLFRNFYHPLVCTIKSMVNNNGLPSIYEYSFQKTQTSFDFNTVYQPSAAPAVPSVVQPYPVENLDFTSSGSYSLYNWELFYDLPFYIANLLSQNQQFDDATTWYHYIFNPTGGQGGVSPQNYWITKPFHEFLAPDYLAQRIDTIMNDIAADPSGVTISNLVTAINNWRTQPFLPDVVCSTRQVAYQKAIFIAYIKHLIAYGDYLFTQNTTESRVQATNLYVLADELMGPQPSAVPPAVPVPDETYNQLEAGIDLFGNALIDLENLVPDLNVLPQKGAELPPSASFSLLYFCIPANDELNTLWSTIANRLYNLRNSNDINGNFTSVALFAPPIDPGMLVRAAAAGLSISSIIADLNAPLPFYRFRVMTQKATELATQVSMLGNALLSALEKKDAEMLSQLRSGQEVALQTQILSIRENQIAEANASINELKAAKAIAQDKFNYYSSRDFMNGWEIAQATIGGLGIISQIVSTVLDGAAGGLALIPEFSGGGAGFGGTPEITVGFGGSNIASSASNFSSLFRDIGSILQATAGIIGNIGSYQRRMDDWNFQVGQATLEKADIDQKIIVAGISKDIATGERDTQKTRISQAIAVDHAIHSKYTNEALYSWMISQISGVYYQAYQLAYSIAKQAEHCYQYELANDNSFIQFGYWNSMQKGLLAGDNLLAAIKQMEASYLDTNRREYELTKNISVAALNPRALLQLINTGSCDFEIPEFYFDMDYPGQYLRRIKTVSVTIPCIAGPLVTVACTLTLVNNEYRKSPLLTGPPTDPYAEHPAGGDGRFVYGTGFIQAIALSRAQNDNGLFELNFDDDRYLPFEGLGAISSWHLEMNDPAAFAQFDYQTITDVVLQLKYTAREGGSQLRTAASKSLMGVLKTIADQAPPAGLFRVFDLRHDFPNNWYAFMTDGSGTYNLLLSKLNFPFYTQNNLLKVSVKAIGLFVQTSASGALQVGIAGAAAAPLTTSAAVFGSDIQYIDSVTSFVPVLKLVTDTANLPLAVSNFATVRSEITGAWLIVNYDLS